MNSSHPPPKKKSETEIVVPCQSVNRGKKPSVAFYPRSLSTECHHLRLCGFLLKRPVISQFTMYHVHSCGHEKSHDWRRIQ